MCEPWCFTDRVRRCALTIAEGEGVVAPTVLRLIEVAALLHDVKVRSCSMLMTVLALCMITFLQRRHLQCPVADIMSK